MDRTKTIESIINHFDLEPQNEALFRASLKHYGDLELASYLHELNLEVVEAA